MRISVLCFICVGCCFFLPSLALSNVTFDKGKQLSVQGKHEAALPVLQEAFFESPENLDISFYLGRAAYETGDYELAAMSFERILIMEPDAPKVKMELGKTYLKLGSPEIASQYFNEVLASNPPEAVRQQIRDYLQVSDDLTQHHFWNGSLSLGLFWSDNVDSFPNDNTVNIAGFPLLLLGKEESDLGAKVNAVITHLYKFNQSPYSWKTTFSSYNNFYDDQSDQNSNYYGAATGIVRRDSQSLIELKVRGHRVDLDDKSYLSLFGLENNYTRQLRQNLYINFAATLLDKNYFQDDDRDALTWNVSLGPVLDYDTNRLTFIAGVEDENADKDIYSYLRTNLLLRYDRKLMNDFKAYGFVLLQNTDYEDASLTFLDKRKDDKMKAELGVSKVLWRSDRHSESLTAQLSYSHTTVDSNISLYEYDKNVAQLTFTYAF